MLVAAFWDWFDPTTWFKAIAGDVLGALRQGLTDVANAVQSAMVAGTDPMLPSWMTHGATSPWAAIMAPAAILSAAVLGVGIAVEAARGRLGAMAKNLLVAPVAAAVVLVAAPSVINDAIALVNWACSHYDTTVLGARTAGGGPALGSVLATAFSASFLADNPVIGALFVLAAIALIAVVWIELAMQAAVVWVAAMLVPLVVAGFFFEQTRTWVKRIVELIVAAILARLIITVVLVLGIDALYHTEAAMGPSGGKSLLSLPLALAVLFLGTLGLPVALRIAPHTVAAADHAGSGASFHRSATRSAAGSFASGSDDAGEATASVSRLASGSPGQGGLAFATGAGTAGVATGAATAGATTAAGAGAGAGASGAGRLGGAGAETASAVASTGTSSRRPGTPITNRVIRGFSSGGVAGAAGAAIAAPLDRLATRLQGSVRGGRFVPDALIHRSVSVDPAAPPPEAGTGAGADPFATAEPDVPTAADAATGTSDLDRRMQEHGPSVPEDVFEPPEEQA